MELEHKRLLIVGGTSGFGQTVAGQAAAMGDHVQVIGHSRTHVVQAVGRLKAAGEVVTGTALDAQNIQQLEAFFTMHPAFDHVLSFLGGTMGGGFLENSVATIRQAIEDKFFANLPTGKGGGSPFKRPRFAHFYIRCGRASSRCFR